MFKIDHIMLRTTNLQESIDFYSSLFGMTLDSLDDYPKNGYTLAFMKDESSGVLIELTYNYKVDRYDLGNTFDHIGLRGGDVMQTIKIADALGYKTRHKSHTTSENKKYILGFITSPEGINIALVEKVTSHAH